MFYLFTYIGMLCNKKQEHTRKLVRFRFITYVRKVFAQECKEWYNVEDPKRRRFKDVVLFTNPHGLW